jgi:hypothetical protein
MRILLPIPLLVIEVGSAAIFFPVIHPIFLDSLIAIRQVKIIGPVYVCSGQVAPGK